MFSARVAVFAILAITLITKFDQGAALTCRVCKSTVDDNCLENPDKIDPTECKSNPTSPSTEDPSSTSHVTVVTESTAASGTTEEGTSQTDTATPSATTKEETTQTDTATSGTTTKEETTQTDTATSGTTTKEETTQTDTATPSATTKEETTQTDTAPSSTTTKEETTQTDTVTPSTTTKEGNIEMKARIPPTIEEKSNEVLEDKTSTDISGTGANSNNIPLSEKLLGSELDNNDERRKPEALQIFSRFRRNVPLSRADTHVCYKLVYTDNGKDIVERGCTPRENACPNLQQGKNGAECYVCDDKDGCNASSRISLGIMSIILPVGLVVFYGR